MKSILKTAVGLYLLLLLGGCFTNKDYIRPPNKTVEDYFNDRSECKQKTLLYDQPISHSQRLYAIEDRQKFVTKCMEAKGYKTVDVPTTTLNADY